jgi:hypothetical protein
VSYKHLLHETNDSGFQNCTSWKHNIICGWILGYTLEFYGRNTVKGVEYLHVSFLIYLLVLEVSLYFSSFACLLGLTGSRSKMMGAHREKSARLRHLKNCVQYLVHYVSLFELKVLRGCEKHNARSEVTVK